MKARKIESSAPELVPHVVFYCHGCRNNHVVPYVNARPHVAMKWFFDEDFEQPTIEPSIRVLAVDGIATACHVVVTKGILNFCPDSAHGLRGQSVAMEDCKLIGEE